MTNSEKPAPQEESFVENNTSSDNQPEEALQTSFIKTSLQEIKSAWAKQAGLTMKAAFAGCIDSLVGDARPQDKTDKFFDEEKSKITSDQEKKALLPQLHRDGNGLEIIDPGSGLETGKEAELANFLKKLDDLRAKKVVEVKKHINETGQDPDVVYEKVFKTPGVIIFDGELHINQSSSRQNGEQRLRKAPPQTIFAPEISDVYNPVFVQYNKTAKDTKFDILDNLPQLTSKKIPLTEHKTKLSGLTSMIEAAHSQGIEIVPIDDHLHFDALAEFNKLDPSQRSHNKREEMLHSAATSPLREQLIRNNFVSIAKNKPNSPIYARTGFFHAAKDKVEDQETAAMLVGRAPELQAQNRQVISFINVDPPTAGIAQSLSWVAEDLNRPVCFPANGACQDLRADRSIRYGSFDYVTCMSANANETGVGQGPKAPFVKEGVNIKQKDSLGRSIPLGRANMRELSQIFAAAGASDKKILQIKNTINDIGAQPDQALKDAINKPGAIVFLPSYYLQGMSEVIDGTTNPIRTMIRDNIKDFPPSSIITIDMPSVTKPIFDRFNASASGTDLNKFLVEDKDWQQLVNEKRAFTDAFSPAVRKICEQAHDRGIKIIPFDADKDWVQYSEKTEKIKILQQDANNLVEIAKQNPSAPLIVWLLYNESGKRTFENSGTTLQRLVDSSPNFKELGRSTVGFQQVNDDMLLGSFLPSLTRPVCINLQDKKAEPISRLLVKNLTIEARTTSTDLMDYLDDTLGHGYQYLVMFPDK